MLKLGGGTIMWINTSKKSGDYRNWKMGGSKEG